MLMLTPMRRCFDSSTACNRLCRPGFARSNPKTCRQLCKQPSKSAKRLQLRPLQLAATNHTRDLFPLLFPFLLICSRRWCPWSLAARAFQARATIAAKLGIGQQSVGCHADRPLPNQLPTGPTKIRANFRLVKGNSTMLSWL